MKIKDKVLIVEDEQSISNFISMILTANGFDTIIVRTGEEALTMIASHCPDMIVLDLGLPDMDGMEVLKSVRKWSNLPVVVVSARNHEHDKVEALDYGADDYLVKPFGTSELLARIRTAIRHTRTTLSNTQIAQSGKFVTGDLTIDYDKHQVLMNGENAGLTVNEYKIVALLGKYAGKVTDVHKGVVYVRLSNGVNAVAHSCYDYRMPGKKDDVSFAVTRLDMERGVAVGSITRIIRQNL